MKSFVFGRFKFFSFFVPTIESSKDLNIRVCLSFFFSSLFFVSTIESSKELNIRVCFSFFSFLLFRQERVARNFAFGYILIVFFFFLFFPLIASSEDFVQG